jgi:hypothetical protein
MKAKQKFTEAEIISALQMAETIYMDTCAKCIGDVYDSRDLKTIKARVKHQGISFLTITLPNFCKDFERSVEVGYIDSSCFQGFRKHGSIPSFLKGMTSLIFDRETGRVYDNKENSFASDVPNIIDSVRQICLAFERLGPGRRGD